MAETTNANGLTLLEGLEEWEKHQRSEGAICNAELLKWARDEISDLTAKNRELRAQASADDTALMALANFSHAAYPGPWYDNDQYIGGLETAKDGGDIVCDMPSEGDDSRQNWPGNRAYIIASANFVRASIERRRAALDLSTAVEG